MPVNPIFPQLADDFLIQRLQPPSAPIRMVLDTDTYNEIDDQFALVYALCSPEKLKVEAVYAAPFFNANSNGPEDGMEKSYEEILRLLERLHVSPQNFVFRGSTAYLSDKLEQSPAVLDLISKALASPEDDPLYVVAIGAITNVATALLLAPEILRRIVVVWLGGNPHSLPHTVEFNLMQDVPAARVIFDCGVPFVHVPCLGVASHLLTTKAELGETLAGRNPVADFLYQRFCEYSDDHFAWGKEIWDVATIGWLIDESWAPSRLVPSPWLVGEWDMQKGGELHFEPGTGRHKVRELWFLQRNPIFRDMFRKIQALEG